MKSKLIYLPYLLALIVLAALFSSCNTTKDLTKNKETNEVNTVTKTVETRTITETGKGTIETEKDTITGTSWDLSVNPINVENENIKLVVTKDKQGKVTATTTKKPKKLNYNFDKKTIERVEKDEDLHQKNSVKSSFLKKETKTNFSLNYLWWLLLLLLIPIYKYRKLLFNLV
jgi:hypothetical protein